MIRLSMGKAKGDRGQERERVYLTTVCVAVAINWCRRNPTDHYSSTGGPMRERLQFPNFHEKSQDLEMCKHEKHSKVSYNKQSHKV
jgi:hypothetical protein